MAKEKPSASIKAKAKAKGQKSIQSFFKKPAASKAKGRAKATDDDSDGAAQEDEVFVADGDDGDAVIGSEAVSSDDEGQNATRTTTTSSTRDLAKVIPEMSELPPINEIPAIFADLVSRIPKIQSVAQRLAGRKLRVATMCSGTESPLLALELIGKAVLDQHQLGLDVEHVFSCEIEPFKQAYIERNFHPPLLFRDVCELGGDEAHTAYGALKPVPGNVDLLVAGTSCVDYSNLNNEKQDIDAKGESGQTFRGMMSWVKRHRPPLVILENVCSAPWPRVEEEFEKIGYAARFARFDTKQYYIAHTRTRVYLIAVDMRGKSKDVTSSKPGFKWKKKHTRDDDSDAEPDSGITDEWYRLVTEDLKRPASSPLDAFLLATDDPRIHEARQKLVKESYNAVDRKTGRTDWNRCERRHERARVEEMLGKKRPLTNWEDGGSCRMPDYCWADWGVGQVERVWDLMDILFLRSAKKGIDPSYKTSVWNLSQNVDRSLGARTGISPCLTPSMIPYITNRGGPMVGLEALSMQGLPVDKLLLTRETEDQLADLAGNAMSTTVVGACILAALVSGMHLLKEGVKAVDAMEVDDEVQGIADVIGEDKLVSRSLDLSAASSDCSLPELLKLAHESARLCMCEGRTDITSRPINRCKDCGSTSCIRCGGRPEHNASLVTETRVHPSKFADQIKATLPMCLAFEGISKELLDALKGDDDYSESWAVSVQRIAQAELRFIEPKRQEIWVACYQSPFAQLELHLHPQQPEWRLYAKAGETEPARAEIRKILKAPVARLRCSDGLFSGAWEVCLPQFSSAQVEISGEGELVPSWETRLGLTDDEFRDKKVYSKLRISAPSNTQFDRDISGVYTLLDQCGTANGALHRKEEDLHSSSPPLFMLLDPERTTEDNDSFVFSISPRRYEFGESRPIVGILDSKWRPSDTTKVSKVICRFPIWKTSDSLRLVPTHHPDARYAVPQDVLQLTHDACGNPSAVLVCRVPLPSETGSEWPRGKWGQIEKVSERPVFRKLAWLLERIRHIDDRFSGTWHTLDLPDHFHHCDRCAPRPPKLEWVQTGKNKTVALEDSIQAGAYERSLKTRPSPFVTQLMIDPAAADLATVRVGFNAPTLVHRALSRLPTANRPERPEVSWKLNTSYVATVNRTLPKFVIKSNKQDQEHTQPPNFKTEMTLRPEQLRSLHWMIQQESSDAGPFLEEEISEAMLPSLGWRAEGRATRKVHLRGGVLADAVGYGKTAITLGLIDCNAKSVAKEFKKAEQIGAMAGKIRTKATLIVVPPHLTRQWQSEAQKFARKGHFSIVVLSTQSSLNKVSIEDIQDADLVIVASSLQKGTAYLDSLELLAANGSLPPSASGGRHFNARLDEVCESLKKQVDRLRDEGSKAVLDEIKEAQIAEEKAAQARILLKRLKGRAYREAQEAKAKAAVAELVDDQMDVDEHPSPTSSNSRKVEVVIPLPPGRRAGKEMPLADSDSDDEEEQPKRSRRAAAKKVATIVISDDEEDDEPVAKKAAARGKAKPPAKAKTKAKRGQSTDDDEDYSAVDDEDDYDDDEDDEFTDTPVTSVPESSDFDEEDEDEAPKKRTAAKKQPAKAKAQAEKRPLKRRKSRTTDNDSEDSETSGRPAKKQKQRVISDPWKLDTAKTRKDWTQMLAPPLEMFHFARKVVDEYTYLDGKVHTLVTHLTAERHWVLSGTPPVHDFAALKTISAFLGLHLGIDDDGEGQSTEVKKRKREQTDAEKFHSFREVHSLEWHANRHELGQRFLDRFVRQNVPEIDEIPFEDKVVEIVLPAAERAIYLELEHHLRALDMTIKRGKKSDSDREKRLNKSLGDSKSAEEALLKRCSHFDLDTKNENAMKACDVIVEEREEQLQECKDELLQAVKAGVKKEKELGTLPEESIFSIWVRSMTDTGVDDVDATTHIREILEQADVASMKKHRKSGPDKLTGKVKDEIWKHREATHEIRRLCKELVGRVRSLRFFSAVRDLQKERDSDEEPLDVTCGHMGCSSCVRDCADKEECVYRKSGSCMAAARLLNVVKADTLGVDDEARDGRGKHYGKKLEEAMDMIKNKIPKDERVLLFVQFQDLTKKVAEALTDNGIKFLEIRGSASVKSKNLERFQENGAKNKTDVERVLLLNLMDESASGANLTSANHAIFLSPLLAPSQEVYDACMTQAVGRLVRYGQTKHVKIWRFRSVETMDETIYEQRENGKMSLGI
ncbi:unnamed protein product [Mycena citricolor]|uniref:Helicase C-terminal domain-containing protein n=1 Tax=Mycena citricolor TaxID=2018698 RepID=A0AAD2JXQ4_9AGAR|nr:unnamed protein product [Mycena citricolor]